MTAAPAIFVQIRLACSSSAASSGDVEFRWQSKRDHSIGSSGTCVAVVLPVSRSKLSAQRISLGIVEVRVPHASVQTRSYEDTFRDPVTVGRFTSGSGMGSLYDNRPPRVPGA